MRSRKTRAPRARLPEEELFPAATREPSGPAAGPSEAVLSTGASSQAAHLEPAAEPLGSLAREWTPKQREGIETVGTSLLVSAAAGSGKTAVLSERCAYLVCDAPQPCDVDELLVVTFTEAAAAEMKSRIQQSLANRLAQAETPRLARQLALIDHAQVSTLHGFCSRLLRQNFHLLGLDPNFTILDGDEAELLRVETARQLFAERYENDATGSFQSLIDAYGEGNDERLLEKVIATHNLLGSLLDPDGWRATALQRIEQAATGDFDACEMADELKALIRRHLAGMKQRCADAGKLLPQLGFDQYVPPLRELWSLARHLEKLLDEFGIDSLFEVLPEKFPNLPPIPNGTPGKELAQELVNDLRAEFKKKGALYELVRWTTQQWTDGCRAILPHAKTFLGLVEEFGIRYREEKTAAHSVDFTDLERLALDALLGKIEGDQLIPSPLARAYH